MAIIERYHWKVNEGSDHDFIKLHREFEDKFREKAGAIKMDLNVFLVDLIPITKQMYIFLIGLLWMNGMVFLEKISKISNKKVSS